MSKLSECYQTNILNPMKNFMPFDNRTREGACNNTEKLENTFNIPRAYTMPVTTSYADSTAFANFLFPNPARCRETGYLCVTNADETKNLDRLAYYPNDTYYQTINR